CLRTWRLRAGLRRPCCRALAGRVSLWRRLPLARRRLALEHGLALNRYFAFAYRLAVPPGVAVAAGLALPCRRPFARRTRGCGERLPRQFGGQSGELVGRPCLTWRRREWHRRFGLGRPCWRFLLHGRTLRT